MPIYTFYPCAANGTSSMFEAIYLPSEEAALDRAQHVLTEHQSCDYVAVWNGEHRIAVISRNVADDGPHADDAHSSSD